MSDKSFKFSLNFKSAEEEIREYEVIIDYMGSRTATEGGVSFESNEKDIIEVLENTPTYGCQTIVVRYFTGGAHGDCLYNMAISCGSNDYLYEGESAMCMLKLEDIDSDGVKELSLLDSSFAYYGPGGNDSTGKHFLPFAESPHMSRYARWTAQGWKIIGPGEFGQVYANLLDEAPTDDEKYAGSAIESCYYALMSGQDNTKAKKILKSRLPADWKSIANKVFADIQSSVSRTDFLTAVPLVAPRNSIRQR